MNWKQEIETAAQRIEPHVRRTPCMSSRNFGLDYDIEFKFEHVQHTGSFKARGAFNTILSQDVPKSGFVAASGGNHGAAVGYAAAKLGHKAAIFVPEIAGQAKIDLIKRTGADLRIVAGAYAEAFKKAQEYEADTSAAQIHAYDAAPTVAGQGTVLREWEDQGLDSDTILIAVGGGGLIAGSLAWLGGSRKIVAVEPTLCSTLSGARATGHPIEVDVSGVAANALGAKKIGQFCFDLAEEYDVECITVSDMAISVAQTAIWQQLRQYVEPAGATALAALLSGAYTPAKGEKVAVLICGANPTLDPFDRA